MVRLWPAHDLTTMVVLEAGRGVRDHQFFCYGAQIWAIAGLNQVPIIFGEDFSEGSTVYHETWSLEAICSRQMPEKYSQGFRLAASGCS